MPEFRFYLDKKITVWQRDSYVVSADNYDTALTAMKYEFEMQEKNETPSAGGAVYIGCEYLDYTCEEMHPGDNEGSHTEELRRPGPGGEEELILTNTSTHET